MWQGVAERGERQGVGPRPWLCAEAPGVSADAGGIEGSGGGHVQGPLPGALVLLALLSKEEWKL